MMEVELRAGDLMYFPRGYIHQVRQIFYTQSLILLSDFISNVRFQAIASKDEHSLHITISTTQKNSWGEFMQYVSAYGLIPYITDEGALSLVFQLASQAIENAMANNIEYRRAMPLNYIDVAGTAVMDMVCRYIYGSVLIIQ